MTPLFEAAFRLQQFFTEQQWQFCVIGGIAVLRWGEPRFTRDVDITLLVDSAMNVSLFCRSFLKATADEFPTQPISPKNTACCCWIPRAACRSTLPWELCRS